MRRGGGNEAHQRVGKELKRPARREETVAFLSGAARIATSALAPAPPGAGAPARGGEAAEAMAVWRLWWRSICGRIGGAFCGRGDAKES
jgi:hypothetical protein